MTKFVKKARTSVQSTSTVVTLTALRNADFNSFLYSVNYKDRCVIRVCSVLSAFSNYVLAIVFPQEMCPYMDTIDDAMI